jgi:hypothetical protein
MEQYPKVGTSVFLRTVTMYYVGRVTNVTKDYIFLTDAAWIADTIRWHEAIRDGKMREVEPYPDGLEIAIARGALVEISPWLHPLLRECSTTT